MDDLSDLWLATIHDASCCNDGAAAAALRRLLLQRCTCVLRAQKIHGIFTRLIPSPSGKPVICSTKKWSTIHFVSVTAHPEKSFVRTNIISWLKSRIMHDQGSQARSTRTAAEQRRTTATMGFMAWSQDTDLATYCHSITIFLILIRYPSSFRLFAIALEALFSRRVPRILAILSGRHPPPNAMERLC